MKRPKISVIIPIYNTERYLRKCLDSVINQTLKDIEIIIINDCTPDKSEDIVLEYSKQDKRIIYIKHEKNLGLGGVRNTGISVATGEYQWHIDSDDFIDTNACEFLYGTSMKYDVDILTFSACNYTLTGGLCSYYDNYFSRDKALCNKVYKGTDFLRIFKDKGVFHCAVWLNLFRSSFIKNFSKVFVFRRNVAHQDTDYIPILYSKCNAVICLHYTPYYRLIRSGSLSNSMLTKARMESMFAVTLSLLRYINKYSLDFRHPLVEFTLKDYNYFLRILDNHYGDGIKHFSDTLYNINLLISKIKFNRRTTLKEMLKKSLFYVRNCIK